MTTSQQLSTPTVKSKILSPAQSTAARLFVKPSDGDGITAFLAIGGLEVRSISFLYLSSLSSRTALFTTQFGVETHSLSSEILNMYGAQKFSGRLLRLGIKDVDMISDHELLSDDTLQNKLAIGMDELQVRPAQRTIPIAFKTDRPCAVIVLTFHLMQTYFGTRMHIDFLSSAFDSLACL
jgi:hypothetical protein